MVRLVAILCSKKTTPYIVVVSSGMTMHGIFNKMASMKAVRPKVESTKKKGGLSLSLFKPKTGPCFGFLQRKALDPAPVHLCPC